jgi:hypothetical protein
MRTRWNFTGRLAPAAPQESVIPGGVVVSIGSTIIGGSGNYLPVVLAVL